MPQALHFGACLEQIAQRAHGVDVSVFEHNDLVGTPQRCPPVRHNKKG
jgi:hypothetical protein